MLQLVKDVTKANGLQVSSHGLDGPGIIDLAYGVGLSNITNSKEIESLK